MENKAFTQNMVLVNNTYTALDFWNKYDGTKSPVNGKDLETKAYGWK